MSGRFVSRQGGGLLEVTANDIARFEAAVDKNGPTGCWEWKRSRSADSLGGYGRFCLRKGYVYAHRFSYELVHGPIPAGLQADHLCRNRGCSNPAHLEAVDARTNVLRGTGPVALHAEQTHCKNGHEFTPENTYLRPRRQGGRACIACSREMGRAAPRAVEGRERVRLRLLELERKVAARRIRSAKRLARAEKVRETKAGIVATREAEGLSFRLLGERFGLSTMYTFRLWRAESKRQAALFAPPQSTGQAVQP